MEGKKKKLWVETLGQSLKKLNRSLFQRFKGRENNGPKTQGYVLCGANLCKYRSSFLKSLKTVGSSKRGTCRKTDCWCLNFYLWRATIESAPSWKHFKIDCILVTGLWCSIIQEVNLFQTCRQMVLVTGLQQFNKILTTQSEKNL